MNSVDTTERQQLLSRIRALYEHAQFLLSADQHCFTTSLREWETLSTYDMKKWLTTHTNHIQECRRQANRHTAQSTRDIRTFIPSVTTEQHKSTRIPKTPFRTSLNSTRHEHLVAQQQPIQKYFQPISNLSQINPTPQLDTDSIQSHIQSTLTTPTDISTEGTQSLTQTDSRPQLTIQTSLTKYFVLKKKKKHPQHPKQIPKDSK